jgi:Protein of unknown function (DUF2934)
MTVQKEALVAKRAYEIWEQAGRPHGRDREHWLQAASEIEQTAAMVNGDAPVHASPSKVVSGDAPVHGPMPAVAKPHKATMATTAAAKPTMAPTAAIKPSNATVATTAAARTKAVPKARTVQAKKKTLAAPKKSK